MPHPREGSSVLLFCVSKKAVQLVVTAKETISFIGFVAVDNLDKPYVITYG